MMNKILQPERKRLQGRWILDRILACKDAWRPYSVMQRLNRPGRRGGQIKRSVRDGSAFFAPKSTIYPDKIAKIFSWSLSSRMGVFMAESLIRVGLYGPDGFLCLTGD